MKTIYFSLSKLSENNFKDELSNREKKTERERERERSRSGNFSSAEKNVVFCVCCE